MCNVKWVLIVMKSQKIVALFCSSSQLHEAFYYLAAHCFGFMACDFTALVQSYHTRNLICTHSFH